MDPIKAAPILQGVFPSQNKMRFTASRLDEHSEPLKVAIVGAGIGGLSAAVGLRHNGHDVDIYEQSRFANEAGAAVHLAPNANGILRRWGIMAEDFGGNLMLNLVNMNQEGDILQDIDLTAVNRRWQHPWHLVHRANLHDTLKKVATGPAGPGTPAKLHTSSKVIDVDPEQGFITLENGTNITADVVIGADGIYSITRPYIKDAKLFGSGKAAFRFLIPRKTALGDPATAPLVEKSNALFIWFGTDRRVIMYPCNHNEMLNFVCIHPDTESHAMKSDEWHKHGSIEQVLKVFQDFDPGLKALISKVDPAAIRVWKLMDMEPLTAWCAGKMALMGDAAHPFTPHQGQGAGQAIEDGAALSVVLAKGTAPDAVPERLKLYEEIRSTRAHAIQEYSRQAGKDLIDGKMQVDMMEYTNHNFGHDELDYAGNIFKRWKWAKDPSASWRMPTGFGPFSGPQAAADGSRWSLDGGLEARSFVTTSVRFKTSRTFLETILPTAQFRFRSADTVCQASFAMTRFDGLPQLGGKQGYHDRLGLYVHGMEYTKKEGTAVTGTYVPVVFESRADSVVQGREELGMPALFCDIDVRQEGGGRGGVGNTRRVTASWGGTKFAEIVLSDLEEDDSDPGDDDDPDHRLLTYRYIPAVGQPGKADAEYACFVPRAGEAGVRPVTVRAVARSRNAVIKIDALDWESLPTLHHVTSVLTEIPIYGIVSAKAVEGTGVPGVFDSMRIE